MTLLILGLILFLGIHTLTTLRETRAVVIGRLGEGPYKGLHSIVSAIGLVLIIWGFARYRDTAFLQIWSPPTWLHPVVLVLMWFALVAFAASVSPAGWIKGMLRHPLLVSVKSWALAHLLANGDLGALILFGAFLAWAIYDRVAVKQRGDEGAPRSAFTVGDVIALVAGSVVYAAMFWLHPFLFGVSIG